MDALVKTEISEFNELAAQSETSGLDALLCFWKAGEIAHRTKKNLHHGTWMAFVKENYDVSQNTVVRWIRFYENTPESKLITIVNLAEGLKLLNAPKKPAKKKAKKNGTTEAARKDTGLSEESDPETIGIMEPTDGPGEDEESAEEICARQVKNAKSLANQLRDKLARAICDYDDLVPNRAEMDRMVKVVQGIDLW